MPYKDKALHRQYRQDRAARMTEWMRNYKVEQGCKDCGYNAHHAGLEFDHLRDKKFNVGQAPHYSMKVMLAEIAKCEVVCGTCHNIRGWSRRKVED